MTDPLGQSQVLPYLKKLSEEGYEFHLISFEKSSRYKKHKKYISGICTEAGIRWHPQDYNTEGGLKKTIIQVRKMKKVVKYLNDRHNFDIVHCRSYISALAGLSLKRSTGMKFVFDMRGFWADERVDGKLWNLKNPLYKIIYNYFKKKEIAFLNESDYTVSLTENGKKEIESWKKVKKEINIKVIPCCVDLELFDNQKISSETINEAKNELNLKSNDFILGYVGSIGTWYMLPEMFDYFKELKMQKPNAKFLFVTADNSSDIYKKALEKGITDDDIRVVSVLHKEVPLYISLFNASIFFIIPAYSKKASSPTKQGEIMAMGVPLVCNSGVGDTEDIVLKYNAGEVINSFDKKNYQNNIINSDNYNENDIIEGASSYFSLSEGVKRYLSVYKEIDG